MKKKLFSLFIIAALLLCACQETPETTAVISKNDGAFDANAAVSASETHAADATQAAQYTDSFTSTDGSVNFTVSIDQEVTDADMPVLVVTPHYFTSEDAQNIAYAIFGEDATFYEQEPSLASPGDTLTEEELIAAIQRWTPYTTQSAIYELTGNDSLTSDFVKQGIEEYTQYLENANGFQHTSAKWEFQNYALYYEKDAEPDSSGWEEIDVTTEQNGVGYRLSIQTRNDESYKLNSVYVQLYTQWSPHDLDMNIYWAKLCRTAEPTEAQIEAVKQKAEDTLNAMGLGEWTVYSTTVSKRATGGNPEYYVVVKAVPVLCGAAAIQQPDVENLKDEYSDNYYMAKATFKYSAEGNIVSMELQSPVDVQSIVNENTEVMSMDALLERTKEQLSLCDLEAVPDYGFDTADLEERYGEIVCNITISELEYGLARVRIADTEDSYYYVPALSVRGSIDYCGKDSGTVYATSGEDFGTSQVTTLLILNAVDGSVISEGLSGEGA